jgi:agmatinase
VSAPATVAPPDGFFPRRAAAPSPDLSKLLGWKAAREEADIPGAEWEKERAWALRMGLTAADSIEDRSIPTFARGELPHYAGINTFLKAPYAEDVTEVGHTTPPCSARPSTAARPTAPARASGRRACARSRRLYTPYNYEMASTCASR